MGRGIEGEELRERGRGFERDHRRVNMEGLRNMTRKSAAKNMAAAERGKVARRLGSAIEFVMGQTDIIFMDFEIILPPKNQKT